jgi:hypothetical protein
MKAFVTNRTSLIFALLTVGLISGQAQAITIYNGQDDGASATGPFPNSNTARIDFLAAAGSFGPVDTHNFSNQPLGYQTNYVWLNGDGTYSINAPNLGVGISGINTGTLGPGGLAGFNVGVDPNHKWLGFAGGSATFNFASSHSFGADFTGLQSYYGSVLTISFNDGSPEVLNIPINVSGGDEYFGFTDVNAFSSVTIYRPEGANGYD